MYREKDYLLSSTNSRSLIAKALLTTCHEALPLWYPSNVFAAQATPNVLESHKASGSHKSWLIDVCKPEYNRISKTPSVNHTYLIRSPTSSLR